MAPLCILSQSKVKETLQIRTIMMITVLSYFTIKLISLCLNDLTKNYGGVEPLPLGLSICNQSVNHLRIVRILLIKYIIETRSLPIRKVCLITDILN